MVDEQSSQNSDEQAQPSDLPRVSLRFLLIGVTIGFLVLCIGVPWVRHSNRVVQRRSCSNNMKQIVLALHNYHDIFDTFPPAITYDQNGVPMHSWRVLIEPLMHSWSSVYNDYDFAEPWNGPGNAKLAETDRAAYYAGMFRCPSAPRSQDMMYTNYVMLIDDRPGMPNGPPNRPGSAALSIADLSPTSWTVVLIEIADSDIHWMEPRDVLLSQLSLKINDRSKRSLSSFHGGACVAHADGSVHQLDDDLSEEWVRELLAC